jgi:hypothetical protein
MLIDLFICQADKHLEKANILHSNSSFSSNVLVFLQLIKVG